MLHYIQINRSKVWGVTITFLILFFVLTCVNRIQYDSLSEKLVVNFLLSAAFTFIPFLMLFLDSFTTFRKKGKIFSTIPFRVLTERGFETELTAKDSRFLFADKRLSGKIDNYLVKIDGKRKKIVIIIGIHLPTDFSGRRNFEQVSVSHGIDFNPIFIEKAVNNKDIKGGTDLLNIINGLIDILKQNNIQPRAEGSL
jgi:predicted aspartyl protease